MSKYTYGFDQCKNGQEMYLTAQIYSVKSDKKLTLRSELQI